MTIPRPTREAALAYLEEAYPGWGSEAPLDSLLRLIAGLHLVQTALMRELELHRAERLRRALTAVLVSRQSDEGPPN